MINIILTWEFTLDRGLGRGRESTSKSSMREPGWGECQSGGLQPD
jgi:hypothetical protein